MAEKKPHAGKLGKSQGATGVSLKLNDTRQDTYILKLYISGMTFRSTLAIKNIRKVCDDYLTGRCDLEIIDIFKSPALAREAQIIAAPTLVKQFPLPIHRLIGDLSQTEKVISTLGLKSAV